MTASYIGRFAPSPTGPLHLGSLVAALASFLDARVHGGHWLIRIEDIDEARAVPGAAEAIIDSLALLGMRSDREIVWQSRRKALYQAAFERLDGLVYPCGCTRREIADSRIGIASDGAAVYPGTCRNGLAPGRQARAWRVRVPEAGSDCIGFHDRWAGEVAQQLASEAGDFVLRRADGFWAYQLAVVVDDAEQQITHVVRGADLLDSTPRQIYLQRLLGLPAPRYLHVPVVTSASGEKLSKQNGAAPLDLGRPLDELTNAARLLGLDPGTPAGADEFWQRSLSAWGSRFGDG